MVPDFRESHLDNSAVILSNSRPAPTTPDERKRQPLSPPNNKDPTLSPPPSPSASKIQVIHIAQEEELVPPRFRVITYDENLQEFQNYNDVD